MARKTSIRDIRNEELIDAAIRAVAEHGYARVTMTDIAKEAETTAASINYYFGSKDQLIQAMMRRILRLLQAANVRRLKAAKTPYERFMASLDANFDEELFTGDICSIWVQFWANAPYHDRLSRLQLINRRRVTSHFESELRQLVAHDRLATVQEVLQSYMDGAWLEASMHPDQINAAASAQEARRVANLLIDGSKV